MYSSVVLNVAYRGTLWCRGRRFIWRVSYNGRRYNLVCQGATKIFVAEKGCWPNIGPKTLLPSNEDTTSKPALLTWEVPRLPFEC